MDYLAPFLARLGDPPTLTKDQAQRVHDDCLQDLKSRLVDMANLIQKRYEQVKTSSILLGLFLCMARILILCCHPNRKQQNYKKSRQNTNSTNPM